MKRILLIPHVKVQNANALSSPYTIGFPAMTAWLGAVHAMQRHLNQDDFDELKFISAAVVCHRLDMQTYKGYGDYVHSIVGTGNPLDNTGSRTSFIEEARCHLTVSLAIEYDGLGFTDQETFIEDVRKQLHKNMKIAGGDIIDFRRPELITVDSEKSLRAFIRRLMPGYTIIERRELMIEAMEEGKDAIDALLDYLTVKHRCQQDEKGNVQWITNRKTHGWIVPIATGFHGITDLGNALNQRDSDTPHRFAESIVTLGEFVMPYRIQSLDDMFWKYRTDLANNLYLCEQNNKMTN